MIVSQFNWCFSGAPGQCLGSGGRHKACQVPGETLKKKIIQYLLIVSCSYIWTCRLRKSCCCWRSTSAHRTWPRPVDASWTLRFPQSSSHHFSVQIYQWKIMGFRNISYKGAALPPWAGVWGRLHGHWKYSWENRRGHVQAADQSLPKVSSMNFNAKFYFFVSCPSFPILHFPTALSSQ